MLENLKFKISSSCNVLCSLGNGCLYVFFISTAILYLFRMDILMLSIRMLFMIIGMLICVFIYRKKYSIYVQPLILSSSLFFCWIVCMLAGSKNYSCTDMLFTFSCIWLSILIIKNMYSHFMPIFIWGATASIMLLKIMQNVPPNDMLIGVSRNFISVLLLSFVLFYYISCHDKNRDFSLIPAAISFYISIYAIGRGGILSTGFLLISLSLYKIQKVSKSCRYLFFASIITIFFSLLIYLVGTDSDFISNLLYKKFSRFFDAGAIDSARLKIWGTFLSNNLQSVENFIVGSDVTIPFRRFKGNLHNPFLQAYASFGIIGFSMCTILTIRAFIIGMEKKDVFWLILFSTLIICSFTDRLFFEGYCEIFLYYFIFYWKLHCQHDKFVHTIRPNN